MDREGRALERPALRRCVAIDPADFAAKHWGSSPLLSNAAELAADFSDLFSLRAVDELLSTRGLRTPFIRMAKDGVVVPPDRYTGGGGVGAQVADQVLDDRVLELFADGHTVVLQGLHRLWPPLIGFAGALSTDLKHPVQINAYVTPRSSTGFAAHYDVHDVFVLQIAGQKRWRIYDPVLPNPLRTQPWEQRRAEVRARAREEPVLEAVLRPGDCLYLPRGYLHAAQAMDNVSVHLTVGVHPITRYDIVEAVAALVADQPELRASLALGIDASEPAEISDDVATTIRALVDRVGELRADDISAGLRARALAGNRPAPLSPVAEATWMEDLTPGSSVVVRRHLRHALVDDARGLTLVLAGRQLELPAAARPAVSALLAGTALRIDQLGLATEEALDLARRLVRAGVLVPADASPAAT